MSKYGWMEMARLSQVTEAIQAQSPEPLQDPAPESEPAPEPVVEFPKARPLDRATLNIAVKVGKAEVGVAIINAPVATHPNVYDCPFAVTSSQEVSIRLTLTGREVDVRGVTAARKMQMIREEEDWFNAAIKAEIENLSAALLQLLQERGLPVSIS